MKGKSILEVIIVFVLTSLFMWWLNAQFDQASLDREVRRWIGGFIFIALSLIIMYEYGRMQSTQSHSVLAENLWLVQSCLKFCDARTASAGKLGTPAMIPDD